MEQRKIIIIDSSSNNKVELNTDATTFGELKRAAAAAGINYTGKDWLEGLTKSMPTSDDSLLPTNVKYVPKSGPNAGQEVTTNNLAYMLTNTNKKIESGALSRNEIYEEIKHYNLQSIVRNIFGRSYSAVSNESLLEVLNEHKKALGSVPVNPEVLKKYEKDYNTLMNAFAFMIASLPEDFKANTLALAETIGKNTVKEVPLTDDELNELFKF